MDDEAFATDTIDLETEQILLAATNHDVNAVKELLKTNAGLAKAQSKENGFTPLHAVVAASVDDDNKPISGQELQAAADTVRLLFEYGAIWNDLDLNGETPGCIALRLRLDSLYELVVDAGVRAELLLNRLDDFEMLDEEEDDVDEADEDLQVGDEDLEIVEVEQNGVPHDQTATDMEQQTSQAEALFSATAAAQDITQDPANPDITNEGYLSSRLAFTGDRLLDSDKNGVMMAWETSIMERSASLLLPNSGLRVLNIGHGMGIIDTAIQSHSPSQHHIIEAHPAVVEKMRAADGWLSQQHQRDETTKQSIVVHEGRWQDVLPRLIQEGLQFDAIYFDTFAEDYKAFKAFFEEFVIGLLDSDGRMSFFHGLGADRQVCYDVYTQVVELDLLDAGLEVQWEKIDVPNLEAEGEWEGVKRQYWSLKEYRLPLCTFVG